MFLPYYSIGDAIGHSGKHLGKAWFGAYIDDGTQLYAFGDNQVINMHTFNPHRELQYGGTTLGFRGKNYWFSDKTFLGRILKFLFK